MRCKFFFRGKLIGTQDKKCAKRPGALVTIEGVEFKIRDIQELNGLRGPYQSVRLARATPDEEELDIASQVLRAVQNQMLLWATDHAADTSGPGCNLPQVKARAEGREETMTALKAVLGKIAGDYKAGL